MKWINGEERLPTHNYTVLLWVTGGPLHLGADYLDVGSYLPDRMVFVTNAGDRDIVVNASHWMDVDPPVGKAPPGENRLKEWL